MHKKRILIYAVQAGLFLTTLLTTTIAGADLISIPQKTFTDYFLQGLAYSIPFLLILTAHEFGHYFAARFYKIRVTLPYYIPFLGPIGTMGAFIRIKSRMRTRKEIFDIGIAGPLAGFVFAFGFLIHGFTHLPPQEYLYSIHPEYKELGEQKVLQKYTELAKDSGAIIVKVGDNLLFRACQELFVEDASLMPNKFELIHYPFLFAGYIALFFTALNLLPIGQLDGGHITFGMFGEKIHRMISIGFFILLVLVGGMGLMNKDVLYDDFIPLASFKNFMMFAPFYSFMLYILFSRIFENPLNNLLVATGVFSTQYLIAQMFPDSNGFLGYLIFGFIIGRLFGIDHPPALYERPVGTARKILGWFALIVFILCFTLEPLSM